MAAEPTYTVFNSTLEFHVRANEISGVIDTGAVTTEWIDKVNTIASALKSGGPTFVASSHNGHSAVRFVETNDDILDWPLSFFDDTLVFVAYIADNVGSQWTVHTNLYTAATPQADRNLFAHRRTGDDLHAVFTSAGTGHVRLANSSTPDYSPTLTVMCFGFIDGRYHYYYDGSYQETDGIIPSALDGFDRVAVGGDPNPVTGSANAFDGDILEVAVFHRSSNIDNPLTGGPVALVTDVERILSELAAYYADPPTPDQPTISNSNVEATTVTLTGSAFSGGGSHQDSQWQVTLATDGGFAGPVHDVTSTVDLETHNVTGLTKLTSYIARVRYRNTGNNWSGWSLTTAFTTLEGPGTPVLSISSSDADFIALSASAYVGDGDAHTSTDWQLTLSTDPTFASPILDISTTNAAELEAWTEFNLNLFNNQYIARVRYVDSSGDVGAWSNTVTSGIVTTGQFYTPFGERTLGFALRSANWDEVWADLESTWINTTDPDAICLVVSRRTPNTPTSGEVDPIFWQGFPNVDKQIIWTRVKFDQVGTGADPCVSNDKSPNGIICRVTEGLEHFEDFTNLNGWRVIRSGGGNWGLVADRGAGLPGIGTETVGSNALAFTHSPKDQPNALIIWDTPGTVAADKWFQCRMKIADRTKHWFDSPWPGLAIGAQNDADHYSMQNAHRCDIFSTWCFQTHYLHAGTAPTASFVAQTMWRSLTTLVGSTLSLHIGDLGYEYMKGSLENDAVFGQSEQSYVGFGSRRGFDHEHRLSFETSFTNGKVGLVVNACTSQNGGATLLFDQAAICTSQIVTVQGLPEDWTLKIGANTISEAFWFGNDFVPRLWPVGDAAVADKTIDFRGHAWPYDTLYLYDPDDTLIETWNVPAGAQGQAGIWGGDVYNINVGGEGIGAIGGPSARNTGTPGGTTGSGYYAYLSGGTELRLDRGDDVGGLVNLGTFAFTYEPKIFYNIVLEATGTTIRAKVWSGAESADPGVWHIDIVDGTYASGAPGLVGLDGTTVDFDVFAAGIGGDTYPTGRFPGTPVWITPVVPFSVDATRIIPLSWTRPQMTAGVIGGDVTYELQYRRNIGEAWTALGSTIDPVKTFSWDTTRLQPNTDYCVRVRTLVACEKGPWAEICSVTISEEAEEPCPADNPEEGIQTTTGVCDGGAQVTPTACDDGAPDIHADVGPQAFPVTSPEECDGGAQVTYTSCGDSSGPPIEPDSICP